MYLTFCLLGLLGFCIGLTESTIQCDLQGTELSQCGQDGLDEEACLSLGCCYNNAFNHACYIPFQEQRISVSGSEVGSSLCYFPFIYYDVPRFECQFIDYLYRCGTTSNLDNHQLSAVCVSKDCTMTHNGVDYLGTLSVAHSGETCQRWDRQNPQMHKYSDDSYFQDDSIGEAANYCRNPSRGNMLFCLTQYGFDLCTAPECVICNGHLISTHHLSASDSLQEGDVTLQPDFGFLYSLSAWCGLHSQSFLQASFNNIKKVWGVVTQGRPSIDTDMWITSYYIQYSEDGVTFTQTPLPFQGNSDQNTQVGHSISPALFGSHFRIVSQHFINYPCVRWQLIGCDDVDDCSPNPCLNGGTCLDKVNSHKCLCLPSFEGLDCQNDFDACGSNPCVNGGVCTDLLGSYNCSCQLPYYGDNCELGTAQSCVELVEAGFNESAFYTVNLYINELNESCEMVALSQPVFPELTVPDSLRENSSAVNETTAEQCAESCLSVPQCTLAIHNPTLSSCVTWRLHYSYFITDDQLMSFSQNTNSTATAFIKECPGPVDVYCDLSNSVAPLTHISPVKSYFEISAHPDIISKMATSLPIFYLPSSRKQLNLLKYHSVNCRQSVTMNCNLVDVNNLGFTMNDGQYSMQHPPLNIQPDIDDCQCFLSDSCSSWASSCTCSSFWSDSGVIEGKSHMPVREILLGGVTEEGSSLAYSLGDLQCVQTTVEVNECDSGPCLSGGTCVDGYNSFTCQCPHSHTGLLCQLDIDECEGVVCMNGATCLDAVGAFNCSCTQGYIGEFCSEDINECDSSPCLNGATCGNHPGGFLCVCSLGYTGDLCEVDIKECSSNPCLNDAQCKEVSPGSYVCRCQAGYTGTHCEEDVNECDSSPCLNQGSCVDQAASFLCLCWAGTAGQLCEVNLDECASSPCEHGAVCTDQLGDYSCQCEPGYQGNNCQLGTDECASSPCLNDGQCIDGHLHYVCNCSPAYIGVHCEIDINECEDTPCQNNGTCEDGIASYQCSCRYGFAGPQCETNIDDCQSVTCFHGNCIDNIAGFTCDCFPGYTGMFCDEEINECDDLPCANNATCEDLVAGFWCWCEEGYDGILCEININECSSLPCLNGGSCEDLVADYRCQCMAGKAGKNCQLLQVDGQWGGWGAWNECSVQCGSGAHTRTRACNNPTPQNGGLPCEGVQAEAEICTSQTCADADGRWGLWSHWSRCSATCNEGVRSRARLCDSPPPRGDALYCAGSNISTSVCKDRDCGTPVDGEWSVWTGWGVCDVTCGVGTSVRSRSCTHPPPVYGGLDCDGHNTEWRPCFSHQCPASKSCDDWTAWSPCSKTCGDGLRKRQRLCVLQNSDDELSDENELSDGAEEMDYGYEQCEDMVCGEVECYHCSSLYDGTVSSLMCKGPTKVCSEDRPLCAYSFNKQQPGFEMGLIKGCASHEECNADTEEECRHILDQTIERITSVNGFLRGPLEPHPDTVSQMWSAIRERCRVCCKASRCNRGILPSGQTVYPGGASHLHPELRVWLLGVCITHILLMSH